MAAEYFDASSGSSDLELLPEAMRSMPEIELWAEEVEQDILDYFTRRAPGSELSEPVTSVTGAGLDRPATQIGDSAYYVFLRGYEELAADVDTTEYPNFKADMKRTIAKVLRWRLRQQKVNPLVESEADGGERGKSRTYHEDARAEFPPGWDKRLRKYDTREPNWML